MGVADVDRLGRWLDGHRVPRLDRWRVPSGGEHVRLAEGAVGFAPRCPIPGPGAVCPRTRVAMSAAVRRHARFPGLAALSAVSLLAGCLAPTAEDEAGIYRVSADGTGLARVAAAEARPVWSPDGSRLAWTAEDGLWTANGDGSNGRLLASTRRGAPPAWSPNGTELAYVDLGQQELVLVPAASGPPRTESLVVARAATPAPIPLRDVPSWDPDGQSLAVVAWDGSGDELYRVDIADTISAPTRLTNTRASGERIAAESPGSPARAAANVLSPAWSPDGASIAFGLVAQVRDGPSGVYLLEESSGNARRLAKGTPLWGPVWSPDGRRLLALLRSDTGTVLTILDPDTGATGPVPTGANLEPRDGAWSPDGQRIAFSASGAIYVTDLRGGTVTLLADTPLDDLTPAWSPDGSWIAFRAEPDRFPQPSLPPIP